MYAWGASDGARPDAAADAFQQLHPVLPDVDAQRSVCRGLVVPAQDGCPSAPKGLLPPDVPARSKPDAHRSAA